MTFVLGKVGVDRALYPVDPVVYRAIEGPLTVIHW